MEIMIAAFGILLSAFIAERFYTLHKKQEKSDQEYTKFSEPLLHFLNVIETNNSSLNYILLAEFKGHLDAKNIFVRNLKGKRLERFNQIWAQYEKQYQEVNELGVFGVGAAIAPNLEALHGAGPNDPEKWEADRKQRIHTIITELVTIQRNLLKKAKKTEEKA
jgi:hypothetical protein